MNTIQTYATRNSIGQYASLKWLKVKAITQKVVKITVITYLVLTFLATLWAIRLTGQVYQFRCQVNFVTVGYFSRRVECENAYQNWVNSSQTSIDQHVSEELSNNPDLK